MPVKTTVTPAKQSFVLTGVYFVWSFSGSPERSRGRGGTTGFLGAALAFGFGVALALALAGVLRLGEGEGEGAEDLIGVEVVEVVLRFFAEKMSAPSEAWRIF